MFLLKMAKMIIPKKRYHNIESNCSPFKVATIYQTTFLYYRSVAHLCSSNCATYLNGQLAKFAWNISIHGVFYLTLIIEVLSIAKLTIINPPLPQKRLYRTNFYFRARKFKKYSKYDKACFEAIFFNILMS